MLNIYYSNQLDLLKTLTAKLMVLEPLDSIFKKEVILVQSQGMEQWLQIKLADELGIAANIDYPFSVQFIWDIYRIFYPKLPKQNAFNADFMMWALLKILPHLESDPDFDSFKHYLNPYDEKKAYQLATHLANLFDQYLIYRSDWIEQWEKKQIVTEQDADELWQAKLWRRLRSYSQNLSIALPHRVDIHQSVLNQLRQNDLTEQQKARLPSRIFIFGVVSLPPSYLELFDALSLHIDVHIMFMNPCKQFWGDMMEASAIHQYIQDENLADMMIEQSHPLLASWGKLGRDHLSILQHYDKKEVEAFVDNESDSLLSSIQQSILEMNGSKIKVNTLSEMSNDNKIPIKLNDDSITLHSCHSEQREVEVLYDYLLSVLDEDPTINFNECVVMVADIDHYAPYIQAVFDNAPKHRALPYTLSDQKFRHIDPIIQGLFLLLELPQSQLDIEYLIKLMEIPAIAKKFHIEPENLKQLQYWIIDSGIRFGFDDDINKPHSWLTGIKRMLLGYMMSSEFDSWNGILPYDGATGLDAELIGYLADFITVLQKWHILLTENHKIDEWQDLGKALINSFFIFDSENEPLLLMIESQWQAICEQAILSNYDESISIGILSDLLQQKLGNQPFSHRFLIGKINFCTLMPMRSVPFKVICLLGMNDGVYPRTTMPISFDLINRYRRIGDRSRRNDDRYLFLEALLSAEKKLYVSYIGHNIQTNDLRYPSILVEELLEYVTQNYLLDGDENQDVEIVRDRLLAHLTRTHTRMPFNQKNYSADNTNLLSYADEWLPAAKEQGKYRSFLSELPMMQNSTISLDDLKQFYFHSIKSFTKHRLGYVINYIEDQLPDTESFNLDFLERYKINQQLMLKSIHFDLNDAELNEKLFQKMLKSSQLPYGEFGRLLYEEQKDIMLPLIHKILEEKNGDLIALDVDFKVEKYHLVGRINQVQEDGILHWKTGKLTIKDAISLWIDHLIFCVLQSEKTNSINRIYGFGEKRETVSNWAFGMISKEEAKNYLLIMLEQYSLGLNSPIFMPLNSSWQWLNAIYDGKSKTIKKDEQSCLKAKNKFIEYWLGNYNRSAECDDYYFRFYPELTTELLYSATQFASMHLLPILEHKIEID